MSPVKVTFDRLSKKKDDKEKKMTEIDIVIDNDTSIEIRDKILLSHGLHKLIRGISP